MSQKKEVTFTAEQVASLIEEATLFWSERVRALLGKGEIHQDRMRQKCLGVVRKVKNSSSDKTGMIPRQARLEICEEIMNSILALGAE